MIKLQELIVSDEATAGKGKFPSPTRRIVKIITKEGEEIARHDPCMFPVENFKECMQYHFPKISEKEIDEAIQSYFLSGDNEELEKAKL